MSIPKEILKQYDVKLIDRWTPPKEGEDIRPLIAMPNLPKPTHAMAPRTLLGSATWDRMRKFCYAQADNTCEICGEKPENLRHRHAHEVYEIDYMKGEVKFIRAFCICALDHLGCIHTGRAITLFKQGNPLYPKEFLLEGAGKAFKTIYEYNQDHPGADLRAYITFLDYLKQDELREPMEELIDKYNIKFYQEVINPNLKWGDWKLIIGDQEYPSPYQSEKDWKNAMEKQAEKDSARQLQKNLEEKFSGGVYDELNKFLRPQVAWEDIASPNPSDAAREAILEAMKRASEDQQKLLDKAKEL